MPDLDVLEGSRAVADEVVSLRRALHRRPELGLHTPVARQHVIDALGSLPLELTLHASTSGVVGLLSGARPGPTILLRADMDALALHEDTDEDCVSALDGLMHACGHDGHTAMLVGAARVLSARRDELAGRVLFVFQPGEENGNAGARHMLGEGLLDVTAHRVDGSASPVVAAYALHLTPNAPTGAVVSRAGALMASSDRLRVTVTGRGGHASEPHRAVDPVPVACEIVQALQTFVTRRLDVFDPGIVSVTKIEAGTTSNVIPETATVEGTMRALSPTTRQRLHDGLVRIATNIAAAHNAAAEVEVIEGYGVTVNDAAAVDTALGVAARVVGDASVIRLPNPTMGAEDFSFVLDRVPGALLFLGCTPHERDYRTAASNHSNRVVHDEAALPLGVALHVALALGHLHSDLAS